MAIETFIKQVRIMKVDEATHSVYGLATSEIPDKDQEICDYPTAKEEINKWSAEFAASTTVAGQALSLGNIRIQHGLEVGGKVTAIEPKDDHKQIWINTQPINDEVFNACKDGFYTGFSIAGKYLWKKKEGDYTRYGASFSEISYVDNPCNPEAHFVYVKADGSQEIRKFQGKGQSPLTTPNSTQNPPAANPPAQLQLSEADTSRIAQETAKVLAATLNKEAAKTKRVGNEDLTSEHFAYVGDPEKTATWKFPIHDASHVRNALARINQAKGIPADDMPKVKAKIFAAAKKFGVEVSEESKKIYRAILFLKDASIPEAVKKAALKLRKAELSEEQIKSEAADLSRTHKILDSASFEKSLYDVSTMAEVLSTLCWTFRCLHYEREDEGDNSHVPDEIGDVIEHLVQIFQDLAAEESSELLSAIRGLQGANKTMTNEELAKAHSVAHKITKAKEAVTEHFKAHGSPSSGMHKDHHDAMHGHLDNAMSAIKSATDSGDLKKAHSASDHIHKAMECSADYHEKCMKMHKDHSESMKEHIDGIGKALGVEPGESSTNEPVKTAAAAATNPTPANPVPAAAAPAPVVVNTTGDVNKGTLDAIKSMLDGALEPVKKTIEELTTKVKTLEETPQNPPLVAVDKALQLMQRPSGEPSGAATAEPENVFAR